MLCLTDMLIGMHAGSVKGNDTCIDTLKTLVRAPGVRVQVKCLVPGHLDM